MFNIAKRNVMLFYRDKTAVFFSLLSSIIVIALYALFLGENMTSNYPESMGAAVDGWLIAGLIAVSAFTGPLSAFEVMIADKNNNILKSFIAAPVKKRTLTAGYILSSLIIGGMISFATLVVGEIYIVINGGTILPFLSILKVLGIIVIGTTANSAMLFGIISFIKSQSAFSAFSVIGATLIGFFLGIYVPIGILPTTVQTVLKFYPGTYMASLLRDVFTEKPFANVIGEVGQETVTGLREFLGVNISWGSYEVNAWLAIIILLVTSIVFYGLAIIKINIKKK